MDLLLKRLILAALFLALLSACAPSDPAALRAMASDIERQQARATAAARAYAAEIEAQHQAATAQVQERDRLEIERLQMSGYATATAIMAEQDRLDIAIAQAQATQEAAEYNLAATSTAQAAQATQTALALGMAYEPTRIAQAQMRDDIINRGLSLSLIVLMVLLVVLAWILVAFVRNWLGWKIEWADRKASLISTPDGTVKIENGEMSLVRDDGNRLRQLVRQSRTTEIQEAEYIPATYAVSDPAPKPGVGTALRLLEWVDDNRVIPTDEKIGWSSGTWQKGVNYLATMGLIEKVKVEMDGRSAERWMLRASVEQVRYQLTSPTPQRGR